MIADYLIFLAKSATVVLAILVVVAAIIALSSKNKGKDKEKLSIKKINDKFKNFEKILHEAILSKHAFKEVKKSQKKTEKLQEKEKSPPKKRLFVLNFQGDVKASSVKSLREEITAILTVATKNDEVVVKIESPGGMLHAYGLASSQLQRIRDAKIPLTTMIDKVAASGGYMMACVGNKVVAAPFAIVGSIGVIAQLPNFHKLLKKNNIDFEQLTAGEYKRTLTIFGENTSKGRQKMQEEIDEAQILFKQFVQEHRPQLDIDRVATGEHWTGKQALELNLVDDLMTSDDYLMTMSKTADIFEISMTGKKSLMNRFLGSTQQAYEALLKLAGLSHSSTLF
jgi:serine protease SohB